MLSAFSAESAKIIRHPATWLLVGIYPAFVIGALVFFILIAMFGSPYLEEQNAAQWIEHTANIWRVPPSILGRFLIAALTAIVFAGEYGWNTWKLIAPHRARGALVAAKFLLIFLLLSAAYVSAAIFTTLLATFRDTVVTAVMPDGVTGAEIMRVHWNRAASAAGPLLVTVAVTAAAALLTRSTMAALIIGVAAATVDEMLMTFAAHPITVAPDLMWGLLHVLPAYHLSNIAEWLKAGAAVEVEFANGVMALPLLTSVAAIVAWTTSLTGLSFLIFQRQDIN